MLNVSAMSALYAATLNAFKAQGWAYQEVQEMEVVESIFEAHHAKIPVHVQVFGEAGIASTVATSSLTVPASHRLTVCELVMRTNKELNLGAFEIDWDEGRVLFRVATVFPPHRHDERVLASLVHAAVAEMDRLTPYLGEVCRTAKGELPLLRIPDLLRREDLLPPAPPES